MWQLTTDKRVKYNGTKIRVSKKVLQIFIIHYERNDSILSFNGQLSNDLIMSDPIFNFTCFLLCFKTVAWTCDSDKTQNVSHFLLDDFIHINYADDARHTFIIWYNARNPQI